MDTKTEHRTPGEPWNKGKLVGQTVWSGGRCMITRDEARAIALKEAIAQELGFRIGKVLAKEEFRGPFNNYLLSPLPDSFWIAFVEQPPTVLSSSKVVIIDATDGRIVFSGDAGDEG